MIKSCVKCKFCMAEKKSEDLFFGQSEEAKICASCIGKANQILTETNNSNGVNLEVKTKATLRMPKEISKHLDKYVVGQLIAKKRLSVALHNHIIRTEDENSSIPKTNTFLIGDSGVGKTLLIEKLSEFSDIPFAIMDATALTQSGYSGDDVSSCIKQLLIKADYNVELAQKGIIFIDEIDKIAANQTEGTIDVSGRAVQQSLLKLIEGKDVEVSFRAGNEDTDSTKIVNTKNIMFIVGGAFYGLNSDNEAKRSIGFSANLLEKKVADVSSENIEKGLNKFGMIPEFLGRFPLRVSLHKLSESDIVNILTNLEGGILEGYTSIFQKKGVNLSITEDAVKFIAKKVINMNIGARGAQMILQPIIDDAIYEIEDYSAIEKVNIGYCKNSDTIGFTKVLKAA